MAPYRSSDRPRRSWPRERGTLAHFAGGEGIHPDDVERDNMPPSKRPPRGGIGEDRGLGSGRAAGREDRDDDWRRGMRGQGTDDYGGQYAGMAAGLRGGSHRGRGPAGYVRRDERIHEDVCERLTEDHELDASDIEVRVLDGEVTLDGTVPAGWARRRAEEIAAVTGVRHIENNLRVRDGRQA